MDKRITLGFVTVLVAMILIVPVLAKDDDEKEKTIGGATMSGPIVNCVGYIGDPSDCNVNCGQHQTSSKMTCVDVKDMFIGNPGYRWDDEDPMTWLAWTGNVCGCTDMNGQNAPDMGIGDGSKCDSSPCPGQKGCQFGFC